MKCFYLSSYKFYKPETKSTPKFLLLSDIHFSPKVTNATLNAITNQAESQQPDYIIIAGDLIDSLEAIQTDHKLRRLTNWLEQLAAVAPVMLALGNHDFYRKNPYYSGIFSKQRHWFAETDQRYLDALNNIENLHLLNNQSYEDKQAYIFGLTQSPDYFHFDHDDASTSLLHPGSEDKSILRKDLEKLDQKLIYDLPPHKAKVAIVHSPVYLQDEDIAPFFADFDFIISGHMHNGAVLPIINDFWRSDRGIFAPGKHLFPKNARAKITSPDQKNIICGAVSTIQDSAKPITFLNAAFPVNIATLEYSKRETLARKPDVKHQYLSF